MTEQPPRRPIYAVGVKEGPYSERKELPLTLVEDRATADSLKQLLDASGSKTAYVVEIPIWPQMRVESDDV